MLLILYISSLIAVLLLCLIDVPKYKTNEKSFSKAWSKSESAGSDAISTSSAIHVSTFERGKLNKSDGKLRSMCLVTNVWIFVS